MYDVESKHIGKELSTIAKNDSRVAVIEPENGANDLAKHTTLKKAIIDTGMSQKEFAKTVGVAEAHLSAIVNGKRPKSLDQALRIAREVGMTVEELWPLEG